ncbi:MAG: hypothetical protein IT363_00255 [Methanoregulaceae archaeon]|nr:hypothetical protein [Methanoregulaceae archaeon]
MAKTPTLKPEELIARAYADRLILEKLTEMESAMKLSELADKLSGTGIGLAAVRSLLASNPDRFAYHERRWIPAARLIGEGRPTAEIVRLIVDRFGAPMPMDLLVAELQRMVRGDEETIRSWVERIAERDRTFIRLSSDAIGIATWAFLAEGETMERALSMFFVDGDEVESVSKKLKDVDWSADDAPAQALAAAAPASLKAICAVAWSKLNNPDPRSELIYDGREWFDRLVSTPGFVYGPNGMMIPEADTKKWLTTAIKVADKLAPSVDVEDVAPIEVKVQDVVKMVQKIVASGETITSTRLLEEHYEITPSNKTYPDDMANIMEALKGQPEIQWVGGDRFRAKGSYPDYIESVPEPFHYVLMDFRDEEGEPLEVELTDDGLSSSLRKLLLHPLAMDVLDEDIAPALKSQPEQVRLVLKSIHRELGTFPMCQVPTGWFDNQPTIQELVFIDPNGRELQVWANHEARLMYNLIDWWYEQNVENGAVFTLTKTGKPNVFEFAWDDQTDPVVFISNQRMEELRALQEGAEELSTLQLLIAVMSHWPKGADFLTVHAEINVVRRTSRRLVASLLSSFQCFYQRSGSPVWHYDAKKVDLGFDKTKKKFIIKR